MTRDVMIQTLGRAEKLLKTFLMQEPLRRESVSRALEHVQAVIAALTEDLPGMPESIKKLATGTLEEVRAYCQQQGLPPGDAEWFYDKNEGCGWKLAGRSIKNWQAVVRAWRRQFIFPSQKNPQTGRPAEKSLSLNLAEKSALQSERILRNL